MIENPMWEQVEAAILALNGRNLNDVYLEPDDSQPQTYLCIGGGAGQYIASGSVNGEYFPTLMNYRSPAEPKVKLIVGGQLGDYPGNYIADLESVLFAARCFFESGEFDGPINWVNA